MLHGGLALGEITWISEAITIGLLQMLILGVTHMHCEEYTHVGIERKFSSLLSRFTEYHSVLESISVVLPEADALASTPQFKASSIMQHWRSFRTLVK
jgi:hypothetical protein